MTIEEGHQSLDENVIQQVTDLLQHQGTRQMSMLFEKLLESYNKVNMQLKEYQDSKGL